MKLVAISIAYAGSVLSVALGEYLGSSLLLYSGALILGATGTRAILAAWCLK